MAVHEIDLEQLLAGSLQGRIRPLVADVSSCASVTMVPSGGFTMQVDIRTSVGQIISISERGVAPQALRSKFDALADQWRRETALISSVSKSSMHPAYQAIIGMGEKALPLIFEEMERRGGHWFWALRAIAQDDPARGCASFEEARRAWIDWWKARQHSR